MEKILYSSFDCLVKCGESQETLSVNEKIIIDNDLPIIIYPTTKDRLSFCVDIDTPSPFYRVKKYNNKIYIFLIGGLHAENVICKNLSYNGTKYKIEVATKTITFSSDNDKKIICLASTPKNLQFGNFLFIGYILFDNDSKQTLIAYNSKKNTAKIFSGDKIEIEKDGFTIYKSPDFYNNVIERYYVDSAGLKVLDKNFTIEEKTPPEKICYKFMSAIKCGDYKNALSILSPTLSQKLNEKGLKQFFGDLSYFYMLDESTAFAISNNKNIIYEFFVDNDKICDISSD